MRSKLVLTGTVLHICTLIGILGCTEPTRQAEVVSTPAKQFTLHGVHVDEKKEDGTVWRGTAKTSEGDLTTNDFTDVDLTVTNPEKRSYIVHSPRGTFDFDKDVGVFDEARVTDESGGVMQGGTTHYDGPQKRIDAEGPMRFFTPDLRAKAPKAVFHLDTGTIDVSGPVTGRFDAGHIQPE